MMKRCRDKDNPYYGGKGIVVCERWRDSFDSFLQDMGPRPSSVHSIERENSDGNYEPGNCVWATPLEQAQNTSKVIFLEAFGKRQSLSVWARERDVSASTIKNRLDAGDTPEDALRPSSQPRRRSHLTVFGVTKTMTKWADECGISLCSLLSRLKDGWDVEKAVTTPKTGYGPLRATTRKTPPQDPLAPLFSAL
jgi:hypothetical protein